jgi:hypothetical protein
VNYENRLWRTVGRNYKSLEDSAPDGYTPRVEVFLHGSAEPLEISLVESRRDDPWIVFHIYASREAKEPEPGDRYVFAQEANIARIELSYAPQSGRPIGFRVEELSDERDQPE